MGLVRNVQLLCIFINVVCLYCIERSPPSLTVVHVSLSETY